MPHHRVLPLQSTLRRVSTFVALLPQSRTLPSYTASFRPLLPFLWPAQNYYHIHTRRHERKLSTNSYRRANNIPDSGYGYEDDEMSKEGKKGGKGKGGNFQLKTPKGTRDCMINTRLACLVLINCRARKRCRSPRTNILYDYRRIQVRLFPPTLVVSSQKLTHVLRRHGGVTIDTYESHLTTCSIHSADT